MVLDENYKFIQWFDALLPHEKKFIKAQIMTGCDVSMKTVDLWVKGNCKIKNPFREMINNISGEKLFDTLPILCLR